MPAPFESGRLILPLLWNLMPASTQHPLRLPAMLTALRDRISHRPHACFFFPADGLCANALPAAVLEVELVLPSRKTAEAALAAEGEVSRCGAFV